jgi:hypothetical protein
VRIPFVDAFRRCSRQDFLALRPLAVTASPSLLT